MPPWPPAWGAIPGSALIRSCPEDFQVTEELGFELSGEGEHCFLYLQKRQLNTMELLQRLCELSGVAPGSVGFSGLKDRNAITRQWFSVGMAGRVEPDWTALETSGDVQVLEVGRHRRKLRRGVHRANRFKLVLRHVEGERTELESRLSTLRDEGVPNYFGEQRFGRNGSTMEQARRWIGSRRRVSRDKRSLYFSALRAYVFNQLLAQRVNNSDWNVVKRSDVCVLRGTRSFFTCDEVSEDIRGRVACGDIHPGLPLWGRGPASLRGKPVDGQADPLTGCNDICDFLESSGLELAWRATRLLPDDFCWQFCDDGTLQLDFALGAGSYATALLAELVRYKEGHLKSGTGSEQD
jgi:tRNA pseudouridine13 synthase